MTTALRLDMGQRERVIARLGEALAGRPDVLFGVVFGSFLGRETFRDIDLGIWTTGSAGARVDVELGSVLSSEIGLPVDVRRLNDAPTPFLFHALRGRPIAVRDEEHLADLMERTARDYHDRAALLRRATAEAFAR